MSALASEPLAATVAGGRRLRHAAAGTLVCAAVLVACFVAARRVTGASWPLEHADAGLVAVAGAGYLASFVFRALGWRRLFPRAERPGRARCLAACGASAASGTVLPFRLDYAVKIATLRRLPGVSVGLDTVALSIVALGLVDAVAILPLAVAALSGSPGVLIAPLLVVVAFCSACGLLLLAGGRLLSVGLLRRRERTRRFCERVGEQVSPNGSTLVAGLFILGCWTSRSLGSTFLLMALGAGFSPQLALVVLCLAAAASAIPVTAGGAVAGMGASAAILVVLGVSKDVALNFSLASASLLTVAALAAALVGVLAPLATARRPQRRSGDSLTHTQTARPTMATR